MASVTTTSAPDDDGDFFDDDNNKAMYLVLPAMILIYGSCCLVYCIHKGRRYCVNKNKKKRKLEKRVLVKKSNAFDNAGLSIQDENYPGTSGNPPPVILTLESLDGEHHQSLVQGRNSRQCQETEVDSLVDVLQSESVSAVSPGYTGGTLRQEMQHLDNQLKAAFKLTNQDGVKSTGTEGQQNKAQGTTHRSDVIQAYMEWKALQKTQPPKLDVRYTPSGDTVVVRIPKEKRLKMIQAQKEAQSAAAQKQETDVAAMLDVRNKINKSGGMPKSMPDIIKNPEENGVTLKKLSSDTKRRIFLSSQ